MLRVYILISLLCASFFTFGQIKNESDLIKQADEHFEESRFLEALPLYSQLVSLSPQDSEYNFRFGTCVIYSGVDRETAIRHLKFSVKKNVQDPRAYYYLGMAYHLNYDFREAKKNYASFLKKADDKLKGKFNTQRQIEMCVNGETLLSNLTDLVVLDKKEVSDKDFFRYYNLDEIGGKIIAKPEEFLTKNDKKKGLTGVVHFDRTSDYIFYSSYGKDGDDLDIYRVQPLTGGGFSKPEKIKGDVNTPFDEDYGFLHADGETLYFCSKGHSSMGGYDVFSAVYDVSTDEYTRVKNLDFAINTPDDDLFYLVDSTRTMAYFSSGRSSALNNLHVYQVRVESVPLKLVVIKGDFLAEFDENLKNSKITVVDDFTGKPVGEFFTDKTDGSYIIPFERAGTYKFSVEAQNSPLIHEGLVEIPVFDEAVALGQELILTKDNGQEKLQIKNYFESVLDTDISDLKREVMRRKAGLDVNASEMESVLERHKENQTEEEPEPEVNMDRPVSEAGVVAGFSEDMSINDIADEMKSNASAYAEESLKLKDAAKAMYGEAKVKLETSTKNYEEAQEALKKAESAEGAEKLNLIDKSNLLLAEAKALGLESRSLLELVKTQDAYAIHLDTLSQNLSANAEIVRTSNSFAEVSELLKAEKTRLRVVDTEDALNPEVIVEEADIFTNNELDNLVVRIEGLRNQEKELSVQISGKKRALEAAKKKKEIEALEQDILRLETEFNSVQDDIASESEKTEILGLDAQNYALQSAYLEKSKLPESSFSGTPTSYDVEALSTQIEKANSTAIMASQLIPDDYEAIASASEELKPQVELKTLNSKLGTVSSGVQLRGISQIRADMNAQAAELQAFDNQAAEEARTSAMNQSLVRSYEDEIDVIDNAISSGEFTEEEVESLKSQRSELTEAKSDLMSNTYLAPEISPEVKEGIKEEYVSELESEISNWKKNESSLEDISSAENMAFSASETLQTEIDSRIEKIASSNNPEEVLSLQGEVNEIKALQKDYADLPYSADFLSEVYEEEIENNQGEELEVAKSYRNVLNEKIAELDSRDSDSSVDMASIAVLKKDLNLELNMTEGVINKLEATEELAVIEETAIEESTEPYVSDFSAVELQDQNSLAAAVLPDYESKLELVSNDENSSEKVQLEDTRLVNEELIDVLDEKIEERVTLLDEESSEANKEQIQFEINQLVGLKESKSRENDQISAEIENIEAEQLAQEESEILENIQTTQPEIVEDTNPSQEPEPNSLSAEPADQGAETELVSNEPESEEENVQIQVTEEAEQPVESIAQGEEIVEDTFSEIQREEILTPKEIKTELSSLSNAVLENTPDQMTAAEVVSAEDLNSSDGFEELVENDPELNGSLKSMDKISGYADQVYQLENTPADSEKAEAKQKKSIQKLEKKSAKLELKNAEVLNASSAEKLESLKSSYSTKLNDNVSYLAENPSLSEEINKLVSEAEVLEENAQIHYGLAEETKGDKVTENEQNKKALAHRLAAVENIEKANWLLDHSNELSELSSTSIAALKTGESEELLAQEDQLETLISYNQEKPSTEELMASWDVSEDEVDLIKSSPAFVEYEKKSSELADNIQILQSLDKKAEETTKQGFEAELEADKLEETLGNLSSDEKIEAEEEIKRLRAAATVAYETANDAAEQKEELMSETAILRTEVEAMAMSMTKASVISSAELANEGSAPDFSSGNAEEIYAQMLDLSDAPKQTVFSRTKNVYSESRPIPVNVNLPEGVVYKVQVGAFRNPISQDLYNEFAPVTGEELTNGITRYTAGLFQSETSADTAKRDIRGIGFSDAFVVAYLNGERISLAEARRIDPEEEVLADTGEESFQNPISTPESASVFENQNGQNSENVSNPVESTSNAQESTEVFNPTDTVDDYYEQFPEAAEANQVEALKGLFYTVQVGVYSKPVSSSKIYGISPLNSEKLTNGTIRYTSGIYNNLQSASARKTEIQNIGITDAFITAYYNGERISISAAKQKFEDEGISVLEVSNQVEENQSETEENPTSYVIFIGSFKDEVPTEVAKAMLFLEESRGIEKRTENGVTSYFTKTVNSRSTAEIIKQEFQSFGVTGAEIREVE